MVHLKPSIQYTIVVGRDHVVENCSKRELGVEYTILVMEIQVVKLVLQPKRCLAPEKKDFNFMLIVLSFPFVRVATQTELLAIGNDEKFSTFLRHLTVPGGGVIPKIQKLLLLSKGKKMPEVSTEV
ncbi:hypothetical protein K501DRAFT_272955 [Backusella circina FSU 941]|nr:hypothetical protein K501DRAFT_272955 [Backusella circina FSU 941]